MSDCTPICKVRTGAARTRYDIEELQNRIQLDDKERLFLCFGEAANICEPQANPIIDRGNCFVVVPRTDKLEMRLA